MRYPARNAPSADDHVRAKIRAILAKLKVNTQLDAVALLRKRAIRS